MDELLKALIEKTEAEIAAMIINGPRKDTDLSRMVHAQLLQVRKDIVADARRLMGVNFGIYEPRVIEHLQIGDLRSALAMLDLAE